MGDEEWKKRLNDPGYKNWIKVSLALIESKEALHVFTERTIVELHKAIKTNVHSLGVGTCTKTPLCNTNKGKAPSCASCTEWVKEIKKQSRGQLLWKNADPSTWHNVHWEIAKCFMNAQGSKATAALVTGPDKTDLSGMLNVLVNCKEFENHLDKKKLPESVRTIRNKLMHCATMSLSDTEMQDMVEQVIALLEDNKELKHEKISQDKVKIIKSLRDNEFELKSKDEEVCIGTALETYALAADRGEEIDENMMSLHEKLIKLIEGNKDLEKKFDDKLKNIDEKVTNMKQEYDAEFSIMREQRDVIIGDLKGRIESLEKNQASGQSFPSNSASSVIGNEIKSFYKNALQSYAQKKKLDLPKYETNKIEGEGFVSTISFEGNEFKSNAPKPSKKEAEQNAAEQALQFIGNEDLEVSNEKNDSPSAEHQVIDNKSTSQQKDKNCKNLLQEIAQKKKIPNPIYNSTQAESGFSSEVMFDGQWYHPDISPQKKKVDAEQKAARFVLACLDSIKEDKPVADSLCDETDAIPQPSSSTKATTSETGTSNKSPPSADRPDGKNFVALLNEYTQKMGANKPEYKDIPGTDDDKGFRSEVTVLDRVFESAESCSSKKESKQMAAKEAMKYFNGLSEESGLSVPTSSGHSAVVSPLDSNENTSDTTPAISTVPSVAEISTGTVEPGVQQSSNVAPADSTRSADLSSEKEGTPVIDSLCDETDAIPQPSSSTKATTSETSTSNKSPSSADRPDGKNFVALLNEYTQKMGANKPEYEDIPGTDDDNGFRSKVTVLDKVFESAESCSTKKVSKQMAAKEAMKYFNGLSEELSTVEPGPEQSSDGEVLKPTATPKTNPPNAKNALQEYVQKRKLDQGFRYENLQDPKTKEFWSKVFVGKRCFKGKEPKTKQKEAEKHVAELALNILEGRDGELDRNCEELLIEYHKDHGFPLFPQYEETACDQGKFSVECKLKKKFEYVCKDVKPKKKDVEMSLAKQAIKELEEENKIVPAGESAKSRLNLFLQKEGDSKLKYDSQRDQAGFTGSLCFYAVHVFESLTPQDSKEEAIASAAMSACNGIDLH